MGGCSGCGCVWIYVLKCCRSVVRGVVVKEGRTRSAFAKSSVAVMGLGTAMVGIPAAFAALTPWGESSKARASSAVRVCPGFG